MKRIHRGTKAGLIGLLIVVAASTAAGAQKSVKGHASAYVPHLYDSRTSIVAALGAPGTRYLPEFDNYTPSSRMNALTWLTTPVADTYSREYGGIPFELDVFYEADNYRAGLTGPVRAVGFTLTSTDQVHYPDVLPSIPWFKEMCEASCDAMDYTADGQRFSMVCPAYPHATELSAARLLPRTKCLRIDLTRAHPGFLVIHYAEFLPAAEELLAEGKVEHHDVNMEGYR